MVVIAGAHHVFSPKPILPSKDKENANWDTGCYRRSDSFVTTTQACSNHLAGSLKTSPNIRTTIDPDIAKNIRIQLIKRQVEEIFSSADRQNQDPHSNPSKLTALRLATHTALTRLERKEHNTVGPHVSDPEVDFAVNSAFEFLLVDKDPQSRNGSDLSGLKGIIEIESNRLALGKQNAFCSVFLTKLKEEMERPLLIQAAINKKLNEELWFVILRDFCDFSITNNSEVAESVREIMNSFINVQELSESFIKEIQSNFTKEIQGKLDRFYSGSSSYSLRESLPSSS